MPWVLEGSKWEGVQIFGEHRVPLGTPGVPVFAWNELHGGGRPYLNVHQSLWEPREPQISRLDALKLGPGAKEQSVGPSPAWQACRRVELPTLTAQEASVHTAG